MLAHHRYKQTARNGHLTDSEVFCKYEHIYHTDSSCAEVQQLLRAVCKHSSAVKLLLHSFFLLIEDFCSIPSITAHTTLRYWHARRNVPKKIMHALCFKILWCTSILDKELSTHKLWGGRDGSLVPGNHSRELTVVYCWVTWEKWSDLVTARTGPPTCPSLWCIF